MQTDAAERSPKRAKPEGPCDSAGVPAPAHGPTPGALCRLGGLGSGPASLSRSCKLAAAASPGRQPHTADEQPTAATARPADPPTAHDAGSGRLTAHPHPSGASATPAIAAAHSAAGGEQAEQPGADTWGEGGSGRTSSIDTVGSSADDADDDDDSISGSRGGPGAGAAGNVGDVLEATRGVPARSDQKPGDDGAAGGAGANSGAGGGGGGASAGAAGAAGAHTVAVQHPGPLAACARLRVMLMNATAAAAVATGARQLAKSAKAGKTGKAGVTPTPELAAALAACYLPELDWEASPDSGVYTVFRHSHTHRNSLRMGVAAAHVLFPDTLLEAACRPAGVTVYFYYQRPPTASKESKDAQQPQQPNSEHTPDQPQTASCPDQEPDPEAEPTLVIRDGLLRLTTRSDYTPKYGSPAAADADPSAAATSDAARLLAELKAQPRARAWLRLPRDSESPCMDRPIVFVVRPDGVPVMRSATYREAAAAKMPPPPLAPMAPPVQDAARTLAAEKWRERLDRLAAYNKLLQMQTWQAGAGAGAGASAAGAAAVASTAEGAEGAEEAVAGLGPEPGFGPAQGPGNVSGKGLSRQSMRSVHDTARRKGLVFRKLSWSDIRSPTRLALGVRLSPVLLDLPRVAARWRHHMEEHARRWPHARCWMGGHALCAVQEVVARVRGGAAGPSTGASAVGAGAADGLPPSALDTAAASGGGLGGGSGGDGGGDGGGAGGISSSSTGGSSTNHMHLRPLGRLVLHTEDGGQFQVSLEVGWRAGVSGPTTVLAGPSLRDLQLRLRAFSGDTLVFRRLFTLPTGAAGAAGVAGSAAGVAGSAAANAGVGAAVGVGAGGSVAETIQPQQQELEAPGPGAIVLYKEPGSADALGMARADVGGVGGGGGGGGAGELSYVDEVVGEFMVTIDRAAPTAGAAAGAADKGTGKAEGAAACAAATDGGGQGAEARAATAAAAATEAARAAEQPGPTGAALGADAAGAAGSPGGAAAVAAGGVGGGGSAAAGAARAGPSMSKASLARKRLALVMVEGAGGAAAAPPVRKTKQQVAKGKAAAGARGGPPPPPLPSAAAGRDAEAEAKRKREQMALLLRQVLG